MTRGGTILITALSTIAVGYPGFSPMPPKLIWNASESLPIGLYVVASNRSFDVADILAVQFPETLAAFLSERGYLPRGALLLKRVLAMPGQTVCRIGLTVTVEGTEVGSALERDRAGRNLPVWQGCHRIRADELFLMNWQVSDSLDGRYFGPTSVDQVIGQAVPLWTDETGDGRFQWRARTR